MMRSHSFKNYSITWKSNWLWGYLQISTLCSISVDKTSEMKAFAISEENLALLNTLNTTLNEQLLMFSHLFLNWDLNILTSNSSKIWERCMASIHSNITHIYYTVVAHLWHAQILPQQQLVIIIIILPLIIILLLLLLPPRIPTALVLKACQLYIRLQRKRFA